MDLQQITDAMSTAAGHPSSGPIAEWIPTLAAAVDAELNTALPAATE